MGLATLGVTPPACPSGTGSRTTPLPVQVTALGAHVVQVAAGGFHTCARKDDGTLWCWGQNNDGELGVADPSQTPSPSPVQVTSLGTGVVDVATSWLHVCARVADGGLWCWGNNFWGDVGDGKTHEFPDSPMKVATLTGVAGVAAGGNHTCALVGCSRALWCWGNNGDGQLGTGANGVAKPSPVVASAFGDGVAEVATGFWHTCARRQDGTLWCWGYNYDGEVGIDTMGNRQASPVQVSELGVSVRQVAAGRWHTCARRSDGTLWCWGNNGSGQLGDGTTDSPKPFLVQVTALGTLVTMASANAANTCATKSDGTLWCWGDNASGQVGDGTTDTPKPSPAQVALTCP
jgi:alpha-tubulin suppressor-like RCC1 family protein